MGMIDYDFTKLQRSEHNSMIISVRAKQIDGWIQEFLRANPHCVVLQLGCGLDSRIERIHPSSTVSWFDVDYPEVIELRKNFFSNKEGYAMIESSVNETAWLKQIPGSRPALIVAEGVLEYFTEEGVKDLFNRLTGHFSHGQMIFDVMNSFAINSGKDSLKKLMGTEHKWAVDDIRAVDLLNAQLKRVSALSVFRSNCMKPLPLKYRLMYRALSLFPRFRNMIRVLRYTF
jgi:O-methyltransferase involved in polyketide biosynthesis